jgi:hypothetical protein
LFFSIPAFPEKTAFNRAFRFSFPMDQKTIVIYLHMKVNVKRNLMGYRAENLSELLVRIQVILCAIPGMTWGEGFVRVDETIAMMY